MPSLDILKIVVCGALAFHGIAHAVALVALVRQAISGASVAAVPVGSWLLPSVAPSAVAAIAIPFWLVATVGFLAAAMSFWGFLVPELPWRQVAVGSAIVSLAGIALLSGVWPGSASQGNAMLNLAVAVAMNAVILGTQLWIHWPPLTRFGK